MNVFLLNQQQIDALLALNKENVMFIPCDYGLGICVGENDFDLPEFQDHKTLLDSWNLTSVEVEISTHI